MQADGKTSLLALGLQNTPEQREPVQLKVQGTIPPWLAGSLYRTGPGTYDIPLDNGGTFHVRHWFDGYGMNHKFQIKQGGEVWYRSRKNGDHVEEVTARTGQMPVIGFAPIDPCETKFHKFFTVFKSFVPFLRPVMDQPSSINPSVTITPNMPGAILPASHSSTPYIVAKTDADVYQTLDAETLEPLANSTFSDMDPLLKGGALTGAHACHDPVTHDLYNYVTKLGQVMSYNVFRIRGSGADRGKVDVLAQITDAPIAYMHSSCMTAKYYILCVWQADIIGHGIPILFNRNILDGINSKWDPDRLTEFHVIDRERGGVVATYKAPPFFCFHSLGTYDDGDDIVIDLSVYKDIEVLHALDLEKMRHPLDHPAAPKATPRRFRLPKVSSKPKGADAVVEFSCPESKTMELPTINPAYAHRKYRYAYGYSIHGGKEAVISDQLIKLDMDHPQIASADVEGDGSAKIWREDSCVPGEPIFVASPGAEDEDDGVILSVVLDGKSAKSMFLVLDAKDMTELARAEMAIPFPLGFHGTFV